jgi:hypothetical protein
MVAGTLGHLSREEILGSLSSNVSVCFVNLDLMFPRPRYDLLGETLLFCRHNLVG